MRVVLLGPPGAGKGTQGERLARRCGIAKYATGDILRDAVRERTALGNEARRYMEKGELVPDDVVLGLVRDALGSPEAKRGFILDGFPRNVAQAEGLAKILREQGVELDAVVHFAVAEEELVRRLSLRRVCGSCGAVYSLVADPSFNAETCDRCGGELEIREDDKPETVRNRLRVYRKSTEPLLTYYGEADVELRDIAAVGSVDEVHARLLAAVGCQ